MKKVAIIGQGYVGLPLAVASASAGFKVVGFDLNPQIVEELNKGKSHVEDISDAVLQNLIGSGFYRASFEVSDLADCEIAIIAVPTPLSPERLPDLSFVEMAAATLGMNLKREALIINESTSYPGTLRNVIAPIVSENSSSRFEHLFAISPERVDPGNQKWNIKTTPRLFSGLTPEASVAARDFYSAFCDQLIEVSSPEVAESAKLFENTFRQVNIALVNEFALIMRGLDIPVHEVLDAAVSKPYGFMKFSPGIGVGGHCIPVDPSYLAYAANLAGLEPRFIELANRVNLQMPGRIVERVEMENGGSINGKSVLICGVAYKPNISDTRESPAEILFHELESRGAKVFWHDPLVPRWNGSEPSVLGSNKFDITILTALHDVMNLDQIKGSAKYFFDCTGKVLGGNTL